ncbi:MAG: hypothetical protein M1839_008023 [Geoglossum umbratile]|nr:MAG: hypothetical protein M1839_008023 [Geoglossum umbratile]
MQPAAVCTFLDSIANLRQGLQFGKPRWFPTATSGSISQTQSRTKSVGSKKSRSRSAGLGIGGVTLESSSSGQKRKRHGEVAELHQSKRFRSGSSRRRADIMSQVTAERGGGVERTNKYSVEEPKTTSLMPPRDADDKSFDNRIFCCLVVSPPGRAIYEFESRISVFLVTKEKIKLRLRRTHVRLTQLLPLSTTRLCIDRRRINLPEK